MYQSVLMVKNNGTKKPHGQTMGSDGSGTFAYIFQDEDDVMADKKAFDFWKGMEASQEYKGHIECLGITTRITYIYELHEKRGDKNY